jgi:phage tail-like protein
VPNELLKTDPLVNQNFFLEIDGQVVAWVQSVSGLDMEVEVVKTVQRGDKGQQQMIKTMGTHVNAPDIQLVRMAPPDAGSDAMWKWFNEIRDKGLDNARSGGRKNGSIVLYDTTPAEIARFNFFNAWPSQISTDALSSDGNDIVKETITLVCERIERKK